MTKQRKSRVTQQEMLSWLNSKQIDDAARYRQAGRRYAVLTEDELRDRWKAAMRAMAADVHDETVRSVYTDLTCEFDIRGTAPPFDEVRDEFEAYIQRVDTLLETKKRDDPDHIAEIDSDLLAEIEKYRTAKKSSN